MTRINNTRCNNCNEIFNVSDVKLDENNKCGYICTDTEACKARVTKAKQQVMEKNSK